MARPLLPCLLVALVSGCGTAPDLGRPVTAEAAAGPAPRIEPLDPLFGAVPEPAAVAPEATLARAAALRRRGAALSADAAARQRDATALAERRARLADARGRPPE